MLRSRMSGDVPPLPQYVFMAWCLVKRRDNFTFTFNRVSYNQGLERQVHFMPHLYLDIVIYEQALN
jgi:hypothetical protein